MCRLDEGVVEVSNMVAGDIHRYRVSSDVLGLGLCRQYRSPQDISQWSSSRVEFVNLRCQMLVMRRVMQSFYSSR